MDIQTFFKEIYFENSVGDYEWFFGAIIIGLIFKIPFICRGGYIWYKFLCIDEANYIKKN